jgi:hypothetical protein
MGRVRKSRKIGSTIAPGMYCYISSGNAFEIFNLTGTAWGNND